MTKDQDAMPCARQELFSDSNEDQSLRTSKHPKTSAELEASHSLDWQNLQKQLHLMKRKEIQITSAMI